jgi:hypothetical protein
MSAIVRLSAAVAVRTDPSRSAAAGNYTGRCRFRPMSDHLIRLGNAWEPPAARTGEGAGRWRRRFGRPGGLGPGDRVVLVVERSELPAAAALNGVPLPAVVPGDRWAHDVTPLLADRNELVLEIGLPEPTPDPTAEPARIGPIAGRRPLPDVAGAVRLEIVVAAAAGPRD